MIEMFGEGKRPAKRDVMFYDFIDIYLEHCEKVNKPKTYREKTYWFKPVKEHIKDRKLNAISTESISQFHAEYGTEHPAAANRCLSMLRHLFNLAVLWGYLNTNPTVGIKRQKERRKPRTYLSDDQVDQIIEISRHVDERAGPNQIDFLADITTVAADTGLRPSDIFVLKPENYDPVNDTLRVTTLKTNDTVVIPLTDRTRTVVLRRIEKTSGEEYLFPGKGPRGHITNINKSFAKVRAVFGDSNLKLYDLRHSFGTRLAAAGVPPNVIMELMAHNDINTTMIYVHAAENQKREAIDAIQASSAKRQQGGM